MRRANVLLLTCSSVGICPVTSSQNKPSGKGSSLPLSLWQQFLAFRDAIASKTDASWGRGIRITTQHKLTDLTFFRLHNKLQLSNVNLQVTYSCFVLLLVDMFKRQSYSSAIPYVPLFSPLKIYRYVPYFVLLTLSDLIHGMHNSLKSVITSDRQRSLTSSGSRTDVSYTNPFMPRMPPYIYRKEEDVTSCPSNSGKSLLEPAGIWEEI